jgi:flagellar assembly protein FliH
MTAYPRFAPPDDFADGTILRGPRRDARIQAEIDAAREAGREEGFRAALDETATRQADALQAIARQMQLVLSRLGPESEALRNDCAELALAAARALAGAALTENGAALARALVTAAAQDLRAAPRLVVRLPEDAAAVAAPLLAQAARSAGHDGAVEVLTDPSARPGDVTLSWDGGAIVRSGAAIDEAVERLVADWRALGDLDTETMSGDGAR